MHFPLWHGLPTTRVVAGLPTVPRTTWQRDARGAELLLYWEGDVGIASTTEAVAMPQLSLEQRVAALERQWAELQAGARRATGSARQGARRIRREKSAPPGSAVRSCIAGREPRTTVSCLCADG